MLLCSDGSFYTGISNDADRRVIEHNRGTDPTSYTFSRRPVMLVHVASYYDVNDAIRWEKQLKGWSRQKKLALIAGDWPEIVRLSNAKPSHPSP
jgi:putative endonuclease